MKREALSEKILMLGVDGLDPRITLKMVREGKMPNVKRYIEQGACRQDLVMLGGHPTVTPPMWTTLACGCYANVHGITGFNRASADSLDTICYNIHSGLCQAEQLWNVFAEAGKKTLVWHWPGSSWPPSSDSPNLYVVDGTSPGSVGMSIGQFDNEMILGANESVREAAFLPNAGTSAAAPCVITNLDTDDGFSIMGALKQKEIRQIILTPEDGLMAGDRSPVDIVQSPIRPAEGWAYAPQEAKEFLLLLSGGRLRRFGLVLSNSAGCYEQVAIYRTKQDREPLAVLTPGQLVPAILDEGVKDDGEHIACIRNMELLELASDGSNLRLYISASMACDLAKVMHPAWLNDLLAQQVGYAPPTSMLGNQDEELINKCMLDNWSYTAKWQAQAINYLIDHEQLDVIFSHFHGVDLQTHMFIRYLSDKGHNKLSTAKYMAFMEDVYRQTDFYLGQFLSRLDDGWTVLIFSDHALVCSAHDMVMLGDAQGISVGIMEELGLTALKRDEQGNRLPEIDWAHTLAVAQRESHIYVNLKGRNAQGIVEPASQYEVEEEIMTRLYGYRDKKTGKRVIAVALRNKDAVLLGQGGPEAGDIIYWLAEGYNFDHADCLSTTLGDGETSVSPIFIGAGRGFKPGYKTDRIIRQIDFAPTVAVLGGVRMPKNCEGAPVYQILTEEF